MRFLLKVSMSTQRTNELVKDGKLASTLQAILSDLKPEAAYFTDFDGKRTGFIVFDMEDASQIPAVAEPFFLAFDACIDLHAVMTPEDLANASDAIDEAAKKYA